MPPIFQFPLRNNVKISDFHLALRTAAERKNQKFPEKRKILKKEKKIEISAS